MYESLRELTRHATIGCHFPFLDFFRGVFVNRHLFQSFSSENDVQHRVTKSPVEKYRNLLVKSVLLYGSMALRNP